MKLTKLIGKIKIPRFLLTIRFKLILSFMVPVIFIIILGVASFQKAAGGIRNNYKNATCNTLNMAGDYLQLGLESAENIAVQYVNDTDIMNFYMNKYPVDSIDYRNISNSITSKLYNKKITDNFISEIYLISNEVQSLSSKGAVDGSFYKRFVTTRMGKRIEADKKGSVWVGDNTYLDGKLGTDPTKYSLRLVKSLQHVNGVIIIDVDSAVIKQTLTNLNFDKAGYIGVVAKDGKEILSTVQRDKIFVGKSFYKKALASKEENGSEYVNYNGESYLFMYSKIGKTDTMLCALMPKATITKQADGIKSITIIIVILAIIAAAAIGLIILTSIHGAIKGIITGLKKAAKGDLTVRFDTKRKDEFQTLINELNDTVGNMKNLILQVKMLSNEVSGSSVQLSSTSSSFLKSSEDISLSMNEIDQGMMQQAKDAEECYSLIDSLSQKIITVNDNTKEIANIAEYAKQSVNEGTECTVELNDQTKATIDATTNIIKKIEKLAQELISISNISKMISEIADQTNLLSLNASIEAARAGEHGHGFAVVAGEIRKLADQSNDSVKSIMKIIQNIQSDAKDTVATAHETEKILMQQKNAVTKTTNSYQTINDNVEKLMVFLSHITENVGTIEDSRLGALEAIQNISAVLEEIAASSSHVNQNSSSQLTSVEALNQSANSLNECADQLILAVQEFTVE